MATQHRLEARATPAVAGESPWRENRARRSSPRIFSMGPCGCSAEGREIVGRNRTCFNNRPLYCVPPGTEGVVLAGDRPLVRCAPRPMGSAASRRPSFAGAGGNGSMSTRRWNPDTGAGG